MATVGEWGGAHAYGWFDHAGAPTALSEIPNANVALFDLAFPGSQPVCGLTRKGIALGY